MGVTITKGARYWQAGRFRIDWQGVDSDTRETVQVNRASFNAEPDQVAEDAAFAGIAAWLGQMVAQRKNLLNVDFAPRLMDLWRQQRPTILAWIVAHPAATAAQAASAFNAAFPNSPFSPAQLLALLQSAFGFPDWNHLRDYIVANAASIGDER